MNKDTPFYPISDTLVRRSQGGKQKRLISWSRQGHIAYSPGKNNFDANLYITFLECVNGRSWQLAPPTPFRIESSYVNTKSIPDSNTENNKSSKALPKLELVSFSNTGWDLFTADENGNVSILVTGIRRLSLDKEQSEFLSGNSNTESKKSNSALPTLPPIQYSRTSFNTAEIFYSDATSSPPPDISTPKKRKLNQVVTMKWLNIQKSVIATAPALKTKQNSSSPIPNGCAAKLGAASQDAAGYCYTYSASQYKPYGAMHPLMTKQACIGVRRNGQLCLWHQEDHGIEYKKVCSMLDLDGPDDEVLDASIAFSRNGHIVVAIHTISSNSLKFYDIEIDWGYLIEAANHLAKVPSYRVPDNERIPPKLVVGKIFKYNLGDLSANNQRLVCIDLISPNFHLSTEFEVLLTFEKERRFGSDPIQTSVLRYQLKEISDDASIHQAFKDLKGSTLKTSERQNSGSHYTMIYKQRFTFNESILSIEPMNQDMLLCLVFCNGMVRIIDRNSFEVTTNKYAEFPNSEDPCLPLTLTSLLDAGFEFPQINFQTEYCCVSPNLCAYVALPFGGSRLYIRCAESRVSEGFRKEKRKGFLLGTAAAIALCHTNACYMGFFTDDLIVTIKTELINVAKVVSEGYSYRLLVAILQEAQRAINLNIDISTEQTDKMTQNQPLQRILTLQLSLGTGLNWKRNRSAKVALSILNMRFVASSVMYAIHTIYSNMQRFSRKGMTTLDTYANSKVREDSIIYIVGAIRWCLDYVALLSKELLELNAAFKRNNKQEIEKLITRLFVVPLVLGKVPRSFLIFSIANIRRLFSFVQKFVEKHYSSLAAFNTPENPMGAFKEVSKRMLLNPSASVMDGIIDTGDTSSGKNTGNDKGSPLTKAIIEHPTIEAYLRIGCMIDSCPVSLQLFEKFLLEADSPLRNLGLDPATSLAVEQQIVCQGYVAKNFIEPVRKLCAIFDRTILSSQDVDVPRLYFYDTQWLRLDDYNDEPEISEFLEMDGKPGELAADGKSKELEDLAATSVQVKKEKSSSSRDGKTGEKKAANEDILLTGTDFELSKLGAKRVIAMSCYEGLVLDTLRKQLIKPEQFIEYEKYITDDASISRANHRINREVSADSLGHNEGSTGEVKKLAMRFCIRCGAISSLHDETLFVPGHPSLIENPVFQHYQRICFCGGSWANL